MVLDNQQDTRTAYIAGLFEGEGSILMYKINARGSITQYRCYVQFTNTDVGINKAFIQFLKDNAFAYHVRTDIRTKRKPTKKICYQITLTRMKDRKSFIEKIRPYFTGLRKEISDVALLFIDRRLALFENYLEKHPERRDAHSGRFRSGCKSSFTEEDEQLYQQYKKLRESSETTCQALVAL